MSSLYLRLLTSFLCMARSLIEAVTYTRNPEVAASMPPIIFYSSIAIIAFRIFGGALAFKKPFQAFLVMLFICLLQITSFIAEALFESCQMSEMHLWVKLLSVSYINILLTGFSFSAWRAYKREFNEQSR